MCRCNQPEPTRRRTASVGAPFRTETRNRIDRQAFACLLHDCLCRIAATLPPMTAEIFRRVDGAGQSPAAVAAALGLSLRETGAQLHLARRRLLESLTGPVRRKGGPGSR